MIAEKSARKKGLAIETLKLTMNFAINYLNKTKFLAKIKKNNIPSIKLFEKIGFKFIRD